MENNRGLEFRYYIEKTSREPIDPEAKYFVLRYDNKGSDSIHLKACRKALTTYAEEIKEHLPQLAIDLFKEIEKYGRL